jgi:lactate 2-monooxygenase
MAHEVEQVRAYSEFQNEIYAGGEAPPFPVRWRELEAAATEAMTPEAADYVAGGAGGEETMRANREAFDRRALVPRMLGDVSTRNLATTVLGTEMRAPVMVSPVGVLSILHADAERAVARAAAEVGIPMCLSTAASSTMEDIASDLGDTPRWYQLYWPNDPELAASMVQRAEAAGYEAIVVTLDTRMMPWRPQDIAGAYLPFLLGEGIANYTSDPVFRSRMDPEAEDEKLAAVQRWAMVFPNPTLSWDDLPRLREHTSLPILVKGVLHPDDARRAVDLGLDGVVVSNHGGRQVDGSIAALDALGPVADAVDVPVLFDSGVRTGSDVVKALALGASAVLVARPWVWGLALAGQAGVEQVLKGLLADLDLTLAMCGVADVADVGPQLLA